LNLSRREYCFAALGAGAASAGLWAARSNSILEGESEAQGYSDYHSTLIDGRTPGHIVWNGRKWRCAMGSVWNSGMDHCLRIIPERARFEIRNTSNDRGPGDDPSKRRSEIRFPKSPRLPNGIPLWSAMSFKHHRWSDPEGMSRLSGGGVHGQLHIGSKFGGSPAVAFRRMRNGDFAITTRGEKEPKNKVRFRRPLPFDRVHHLVSRVILHPIEGSLAVWVDGEQVLDLAGVSIGAATAECYWSIGCYFAGGISCPVIAEIGDHHYPGTDDLRHLIRFRPRWG
jgi:hypothetical protein